MKLEYADKINSLLQCFHFNKEFLEWNHDYSLQLLRHGVSTFIISQCFKAKVMKVRLENYVKLYFMLQEEISLSHMICL